MMIFWIFFFGGERNFVFSEGEFSVALIFSIYTPYSFIPGVHVVSSKIEVYLY